jgi:hypothetical protein
MKSVPTLVPAFFGSLQGQGGDFDLKKIEESR